MLSAAHRQANDRKPTFVIFIYSYFKIYHVTKVRKKSVQLNCKFHLYTDAPVRAEVNGK